MQQRMYSCPKCRAEGAFPEDIGTIICPICQEEILPGDTFFLINHPRKITSLTILIVLLAAISFIMFILLLNLVF